MNEENIETLNEEESLVSITRNFLIPKPNDLVNSKSNDIKNLKIENMPLEIQDNFDEKDCVWGIKQNGNKYKSVIIKNELYALNDCVCCRSGLELDYIGKIMKLFQENDQKVCTLRWFFRPFELPTSLKEVYKTANTRELFLAFGEGIGVENKNPLVSCYNISNIRSFYNVENVVSLGVITSKCKVLCIAKDDFNDLPSSEHLDTCDFFFKKAFNCDTLQIIGLDVVVDAIGAQKVYNKKEWLNWNKSDTSSLMKTICESHSLQALPTNLSDANILPLGHHNSSSTIIEQPTKKTLIKKRKRDSIEKIVPSSKMMEKIKKVKLSTPSKNPKLSVIMNLTKHEDEATKLGSEVKSSVTIIDAPNIEILSSKSTLYKGFNPNIDKSLENGKIDENSKNYIDLSSNVPMILEQFMEKVGNNVDDIHITCEGFPTENFSEPLEKSESSTSKLKKDDNNLQFYFEEHKTNEIRKPPNFKRNKVKNKTNFAKEQEMTSKIVQNQKIKKSSDSIIDTIEEEEITKTKFVKCSILKRPKNKIKEVINRKIQDQILLDTLHWDKFEKHCEDIVKEHEVDCLEDQQLHELPFATKPIISGKNLTKRKNIGTLQSIENIKSPTKHNIAMLLEQNFEPECEEWIDEMAITTRRVLLLYNIDPKLRSVELQEALSKFLDTTCQVQKIMPKSFYYTTSVASVLLKFSTQDIAQKSLQTLSEDHLIVGERTLIATLYEDLEFANKLNCFDGHICIQPKCEMLKNNHIEMDLLPHVAQGNTIEFTYGLQWRLLQEQHELQWQLLNEFHEKELDLLSKEGKTNKQLRKSK